MRFDNNEKYYVLYIFCDLKPSRFSYVLCTIKSQVSLHLNFITSLALRVDVP